MGLHFDVGHLLREDAVDPARKIKRKGQQQAVKRAGVTERAIQASLKKTVRQPKGIEVQYQAFLVSLQRQVNAEIRKALPSLYATLDLVRFDALSDDVVSAFDSLRATIRKLSIATAGVLTLGVQNFGAKTQQFNDAKYDDPLMRLLGIGDVSADIEQNIVSGWVTENVQLVANMNVEQVGKMETLFLRSLRDGSRSGQVVGEVNDILGGSINRARLIARDQIGKLDGQLTRQKQLAAGIPGYVWRGALDARERPSHVAREGLKFKWASPPPDGHPGQAVLCRCNAEPDLSHLGVEFDPEPRSEADFSQTTPEKQREAKRIQAQKRARRAKREARAARPQVVAQAAPPPPLPIAADDDELVSIRVPFRF